MSRSPATDRLTQSQKVTEVPKSSLHSIITGQMTKSTGHWTATGHTDTTNVTSGSWHQATDSHQTPDNIQQQDIQETPGIH